MTPEQAYRKLATLARVTARPLDEVAVLYALECFLERLQHTRFAGDFVLKGGVLLAAYQLRRPTRDIDMQALGFPLDEEHLKSMVEAVAETISRDGARYDSKTTTIEYIRDEDEYSGLRAKIGVDVGRFRSVIALDISTGDPIWPEAQRISMPQLLGGEFEMLGYPLPMVIAEKSVTMLQRGTASTRWRDLMDLRKFALSRDFTYAQLRGAAEVVAKSRSIALSPTAEATEGWAAVSQPRWAAWRTNRADYSSRTLADFDEQLAEVVRFIDPVFDQSAAEKHWDHDSQSWAS